MIIPQEWEKKTQISRNTNIKFGKNERRFSRKKWGKSSNERVEGKQGLWFFKEDSQIVKQRKNVEKLFTNKYYDYLLGAEQH